MVVVFETVRGCVMYIMIDRDYLALRCFFSSMLSELKTIRRFHALYVRCFFALIYS